MSFQHYVFVKFSLYICFCVGFPGHINVMVLIFCVWCFKRPLQPILLPSMTVCPLFETAYKEDQLRQHGIESLRVIFFNSQFLYSKQDHRRSRYHRRLLDCQSLYFQLKFFGSPKTWGSSNSFGSLKSILPFEMIKFHQAHKSHQSILKASWKNPANILQTSREHTLNIL